MARDSSRSAIDLDAATVLRLEELQVAGGLESRAQVIDQALEIFHWVARERAYGARVVSIDAAERTLRELNLSVLDVIAEKARRRRAAAVAPPRATPL